MHLQEIEGFNLVSGLRWKSATNSSKLDKDIWLDEYLAKRGIECFSDGRYSVGVAEDSVESDWLPAKCLSLAAVCATEYLNAVFLMKFQTEGEVLYWGAIINKGVPERDVTSENLRDVIDPIISKLSDTVSGVLVNTNPILALNFSEDEQLESDELIKLLAVKEFNKQKFDYDDLLAVLNGLTGKTGALKILKGSGFDVSYFKDFQFNKDTILIIFMIFGLSGLGLFYSGAFESEQEYDPFAEMQSRSQAEIMAEENLRRSDTQRKVSKSIKDQLIGMKGRWLKPAIKEWDKASSYAGGYSKVSLVCNLATAMCDARYIPGSSYSDFNLALKILKKEYKGIVFTMNGEEIIGSFDIDKNSLFLSTYLVPDLPEFDRGQNLIGPMRKLSHSRPGMVSQLSAGEVVTVKMEKGYSGDVPFSFVLIGWTASGDYLHQLDTVLDTFGKDFVTFNHLRVEYNKDGSKSFTTTGAYLMQQKKEGIER
jgi:hypothetical protein